MKCHKEPYSREKQHRRHRHRWRNNIKMVLGEIGCKGRDWIVLAWNRVDSLEAGNFLTNRIIISFSSNTLHLEVS
jgi:hypothetical protein